MSDRNVTYIRRNFPLYYAMQTLADGTPDKNRRTLYRHTAGGDYAIAVFNQEMDVWTPERESELNLVIKALIEAKKSNPDPELSNKFRLCAKCGYYHHISVSGHHRDAWQLTKSDLDNRYAEGWIDVS
jgi:hypothetical protein